MKTITAALILFLLVALSAVNVSAGGPKSLAEAKAFSEAKGIPLLLEFARES